MYNDIKGSGDIKAFRIFIERFPDSIYAEFALLNIELLKENNLLKQRVSKLNIDNPKQKTENMNKDSSDRRKAETFPIITLTEDNFSLCGDSLAKGQFSPYEFRKTYDRQIVYLTIEHSYGNSDCKERFIFEL